MPKPEERLDLAFGEERYVVLMRRSARAKRYTLRVRASDRSVVLSMPLFGSVGAARDFAQRHAGWIATRLARLPSQIPFEPGALLPLRGVEHRLEHRPEARGTVWVEQAGSAPPILAVAGAPEHFERRVMDFLRKEARRDLTAACERHGATIDVGFKRLTIKDTKSRWGSCSADGALSFSWRLILAPPQVLNYLAAHEMAHRRHMNHSARFWRLVKSLDPETDEAESWLKRHGQSLHRYGR